jgi:hypothetical protein
MMMRTAPAIIPPMTAPIGQFFPVESLLAIVGVGVKDGSEMEPVEVAKEIG